MTGFERAIGVSRPARRLTVTGSIAGGALILLAACAQTPSGVTSSLDDERSSLGAYLAGSAAANSGDYRTAAGYFDHALKRDPKSTELLRRGFEVAIGAGRMDQAVALSRRLVVQEPLNAGANLVLAIEDIKGQQYLKASARLRDVPRSGINNLILPLVEAWIAAGQNDPQTAIAALRPIGDISAFAVLYDLHAGLVADLLGRADEAQRHYEAILATDPEPSYRVVELIGNFFERSGRPELARKLYDNFTTRNPDTLLLASAFERLRDGRVPRPLIASVGDGVAEAMFDIGSILQHERPGDDTALLASRLALSAQPDFPLAQMLLADALESEGREAEAIAAYQTIAPNSPFRWTARLRVAANLDAAGRTEEALGELQAMATERPERVDALAQRGDILRAHDRFAEAVQAYDAAVGRLPQVQPRHWSLLFNRAIALERSGQIDRAEADLRRTLELQPDEPYVLNYLGYTWLEHGRNLQEARRLIEKAARLRPNDGDIVDSLGWAHYRLGEYDKAVIMLERAAELKPQDATINDHLGDAYWQVGRRVEAMVQWRRALSLDADPTLKAAINRKLTDGGPDGAANAAERAPKKDEAARTAQKNL